MMIEADPFLASTRLHDDGYSVEGFWDERSIFQYVYRPSVPKVESPKPYFHPLNSLDGEVITEFRPNDHPWHHGLSMTLTLVNGHNFWGGPTFRREDGYRFRTNHGSQDHCGWINKICGDRHISLKQAIEWRTGSYERLISENRQIDFDFMRAGDGWYEVCFEFCLSNVSGEKLNLDTYASSEGLTGSLYTGLQFRGNHKFCEDRGDFKSQMYADGKVREQAEIHGNRWSWVAIRGKNSGQSVCTIVFCDDSRNLRSPSVFFVRRENSQVAFSFVGDRSLRLFKGDTIRLRYKILVGTGAREPEEIQELIDSA